MADKWPKHVVEKNGRWQINRPEQRYEAIVRLLEGKPSARGCEIGCRNGDTTVYLLEHLPGLEQMYAVDPWSQKPQSVRWPVRRYRSFLRKVKPHIDRVTVIRKFSQHAQFDIPPASLDFIFIDGDHKEAPVRWDISLAELWVKPGGLIAGHDYMNHIEEWAVKRVVDELYGDKVELAGDQTWYVWKD